MTEPPSSSGTGPAPLTGTGPVPLTGTGPGLGPAADPAHCTSCGRPVTDCAGCARALDPPHFCATCGTRLAVRVSPAGWVGRCKHHGEVARA